MYLSFVVLFVFIIRSFIRFRPIFFAGDKRRKRTEHEIPVHSSPILYPKRMFSFRVLLFRHAHTMNVSADKIHNLTMDNTSI